MPVYRTAAGLYVSTQAEAGKGYEIIELPATKAELLGLLNETVDMTKAGSAVAARVLSKADDATTRGVCPLCNRDHRKAAAAAKLLTDGLEADAIGEMIMEKPGFFVANVAGAVIARLEKLRDGV